MIEALKPYAEYKESGSRWIGSVPSSWTVRNLRTLITSRSERNRPDLPLLSVAREKGVFVRSLTDANENHNFIPDDLTNYKVAHAGDLVINKMKAWQGSMGIAPCDGIVSPAYFVFDFRIANRAFGQALLRSKPYVAHFGQASDGVRIGQWDLSIPGMRQIPILVPNEDEQASVVRFLDQTNRKSNLFIRTKRRLIELLNEQKQVTIHRAVTRGLDPNVQLKPSGIDWLGDVPEHWSVMRVKQCAKTISKGTTPSTEGREILYTGTIRFLKAENINNGKITNKPLCFIDEETHNTLKRSQLMVNDILFVIAGATLGKIAIIQDIHLPANTNQAVAFVRPNNRVLPEYLALWLQSSRVKELTWLNAVQSAQPNLSMADLGNFMVPLPTKKEQSEILDSLDSSIAPLNSSIDFARREIELLREYRTRLISDVVTGKLDVRGVVDVLRKGIQHGAASVDLFYGAPSPGNPKAVERFAANLFSVTRQLRYSRDESQLSIDLAIFINGLPIITFELKNRLTKQTVQDAVEQYMRDRDPRELLFQFGRCLVHFAVDDQEVRFCTNLKGNDSWFLPFNKGYNDGAGNPPNPDGIKSDYMWRSILIRRELTDIIENYAQIVERKDDRTGKKKKEQIFPRYHQLDVVQKLLTDVHSRGAGYRYLIQHSAGSGKSNSIAWLSHQLVGLEVNGVPIFDSIIVVTDRKNLDKQIRDTIKGFSQVSSIVGAVTEGSGQLREFLESGKRIIITTVQKFPFVLKEIGDEHRGRKFAIIIDEAHSSQGGRTAAKMNIALSPDGGEEDEETIEDTINRIMESKKMLPNASYFAFTATPKNKTLEIFGEPYQEGDVIKHRPFHSYTMKQAIQEGFILDVLQNYTPVESYYRLMKKIEDDPEFDTKKAQKKLRRYVESHKYAIEQKAEVMVDHFLEQVIAKNKIGGQARSMVVTSSINRAIQYYFAFCGYLKELKRVLFELLSDHTELFKQFSDNMAFKKWLAETNFDATYTPPQELPGGVE